MAPVDVQHTQTILMSMRTRAHQPTWTVWYTAWILEHYGLNLELMTTSLYMIIVILMCCSSLMVHFQPFTSDFPRGDIYQMISPDLLHQVIKGAFKDHLVRWICEYIVIQHGERRGNVILDDIDRRYVFHMTLMTHSQIIANLLPELLRCPHFRNSADFLRVGVSSSGREMTPRL